MTLRDLIQSVLRLDDQTAEIISRTKYSFEVVEPPIVVSLEDCERLVSKLLATPSYMAIGVDWARYLLGRRDVVFQAGAQDLVRDLLEDLAFSRVKFDIDESYLETMLARIGLRSSGW